MNIGILLPGLLFVGCMLLVLSLSLMVVASVKARRQRLKMRYEASISAGPPEPAPAGFGQAGSLRRPVIVAPWAPWGEYRDVSCCR